MSHVTINNVQNLQVENLEISYKTYRNKNTKENDPSDIMGKSAQEIFIWN